MSDKERAMVDWLDSVVEIQNRLKELDEQGDKLGLMYCLGNMGDTIQLNSKSGYKVLCKALKIKKKDIKETILPATIYDDKDYIRRSFEYKGYSVIQIEENSNEQTDIVE